MKFIIYKKGPDTFFRKVRGKRLKTALKGQRTGFPAILTEIWHVDDFHDQMEDWVLS